MHTLLSSFAQNSKGKGCLGILHCYPAFSTDFWPLCHQAPWARSKHSPSCGCVGQPPASTTASARQSRCLAFWPLYLQYGIHMACNNTSEISHEEPRKRFCQMTDDGSVWMHGFSEGAAMQSYLSKCLLFLASWAPAGCPMAYLLRQPIHLAYRKENGCVFAFCVFSFFLPLRNVIVFIDYLQNVEFIAMQGLSLKCCKCQQVLLS